MSDHYMTIADRMPVDLHTVYMRGFPGYMDMDKIRGRCSFAFHKKSLDGNNLFLALRFDDQRTAQDVLRRFNDRNILGHRIQMQYFKNHQQAKEIADRRQEARRDLRQPRRDFLGQSRSHGRLSDLRSDLSTVRGRSNGGPLNRRGNFRPNLSRSSNRAEDIVGNSPLSNYEEDDHRQATHHRHQHENADRRQNHYNNRRHNSFRKNRRDSEGDEEEYRRVHPPRSPSCSPPASPDDTNSHHQEIEDSPPRNDSRTSKHHRSDHSRHKRNRSHDRRKHKRARRALSKSSRSRSRSPHLRSESPVSIDASNDFSREENADVAPPSPPKDAHSTTQMLNLDVQQSESPLLPATNGVSSTLSPKAMESIVSKKFEAVKKYQEKCESIASVANMFIRENPSATEIIQNCMTATLRRLADSTVKEVDEFVKGLSQSDA